MAQTLANDGSSNLNSTGSGIKLRANSSGVPMSHDDVDTNFENLRAKINEVIGEVGTNTTKLSGIATGANNYSLPLATHTVPGGIELFSNTDQTVAANSVSTTAGRTYGIQLNSANQAVVNVPWSNTTYSTATSSLPGLSKLGSNTQQNTAANSVTPTANRTYAVQHNSADQLVVNVPWSNTNTTYSTATSSDAGLVKIGYSENGNKYPVELASGKMFVEVPWTDTDTNTTYTQGTGISISGNVISATGGGVANLDYYDAKLIVPQTIVARVSATGISGFPLATSFTAEHTIGTGGVIFPAVTFPTMQMFQQYLRHHFGNKIWGDVIVRVDGTVSETLTESITCRNMILQGWSGAPDTGSLAKAHLVFDCTNMVGSPVFFANHNQQSGNFFNLSNISVHVSGARPLSVVKLEGGMYCQIDDTGFNFAAGCAPKYVTVAEGGSTLVFYKRIELNRNDGSPPTTNVADNSTWNVQDPSALVYVENSKVEFYSPFLDPIVFNGLFTTAEVGDHGAIEFHPAQQVNGATNVAYQDLPTFWKIGSSQSIKGLTGTVPVFNYPDVGTERTVNHPDINFYAGVNFTGGYGSVNIIDNHLIDIENTSQNLMGNFIVRHEDSAFSSTATGSVGDVNKNYINTMEFNKQRSSDGTLTVPNFSGGNGEGTFASAAGTTLVPRQYAHTNMNVFANGSSQATPITDFSILTA